MIIEGGKHLKQEKQQQFKDSIVALQGAPEAQVKIADRFGDILDYMPTDGEVVLWLLSNEGRVWAITWMLQQSDPSLTQDSCIKFIRQLNGDQLKEVNTYLNKTLAASCDLSLLSNLIGSNSSEQDNS